MKQFGTFVILLILFGLPLSASPTKASDLSDGKLPTELNVAGQLLSLNGIGVRQYMFVSVYVAGLYTVSTSRDENELLARVEAAKEPLAVRMYFKRAVSEADMRDAWRHYLKKNSPLPWSELEQKAEAYLKTIPGVQVGDILTHTFAAGKMTVVLNQKDLSSHADSILARTVLATWIGKYPTTEKLKRGLLGEK